MQPVIEGFVSQFEAGAMSRRQLVERLSALMAVFAGTAGAAGAQPARASAFQATAVHHIALKVTDLDRSQAFYQQHLGVAPMQAPGAPPFMRFFACGAKDDCWPTTHLLNLWKADAPGLHHVCFSVKDFDQADAVAKLKASRLEPEQRGNSAYVRDPDGHMIQIGGRDAD